MNDNFSPFEDGFTATIKKISLVDYLQLIMMNRRDKTIEVKQDNFSGIIQINQGRITFSKSSTGKEGMDALLEIMLLNNGDFSELETSSKFPENIKDNGNILLQIAEYIDKIKNSENKAEKIIKKTHIENSFYKNIKEKCERENILKDWGKNIDGLLEIALVSTDDKIISGFSFRENKEMFLYGLYLTELIRDAVDSFKVSKFGDFEELTLSSKDNQIFMQMVDEKFFIGLAISKKVGSIGFVKLEIKKLIPKIKELLNKL